MREIKQDIFAVQEELKNRGITLLIVIVPNKSTIYPDYMPAEIPVIGERSRLDQLSSYLRRGDKKIRVLDLRPALREARKEHQIYYSTDTHWNDYGAHAAYSRIISTLGQAYPVLQPHPLADFRYESFGMQTLDLSVNIGASILKEEKFQLKPTFDSATNYKTLALDNGRRITLSWNPDQRLPRALIYHDSFFFQVNPMLGAHFSNATYIPHYTGDGIWDLDWIDQQDPDIIIVEFAERYIHDLTRLLKP
ncbi:MAG: hypothetical protein EHM81_00295 [Chloroflexi bacterium]|nr:MAG: hypothetical protein EHM81_00295 [Chloroflexota bacterium]